MKPRHLMPFGLLEPDKPRHYREMLRIGWDNKDEAAYAMRILQHGVCDGCSLGPRGLKDDVMPGTHLCLTRLNLLRMNTMGAMPDGAWEDGDALRALGNEGLRKLGRVPYPLLMRKGEKGFTRIAWDQAIALAAGWIRETAPARQGYFVTSRGITNETYYVSQKLARIAGRTNNVDLCSRLCHAPTVTALKETLGYSAPTCSLSDLIGTDMLVLFGTDLANNQPVTTKYMHMAKKRGTRIVVINPVREPGLERYWIPSVLTSALFGTKLMDDFYQVNVGGDIAFIQGTLKAMLDIPGAFDATFIREHTHGFAALEAQLREATWDALEASSGVPRAKMDEFAKLYADAKSAVLLYSMGLTQHTFGVDNIRAIVNLALARGNIGREKTGIMPIRGHSGVQGGGECGVDPHRFPGAFDVNQENAAALSRLWGAPVPAEPGLFTGEMMEAILREEMDFLYLLGGNLKETMPDPKTMEHALSKVKYRIHQDIVLNSSTVVPAAEAVLVLPAQTRYEQRTGGTTTSTERRIRFTPEIPGRRIGEARPEWEIPAQIGAAVSGAHFFDYPDTATIRREMAAAMPMYAGIEHLSKEGDSLQWGGPHLGAGGVFNTRDGRGRFTLPRVPHNAIPAGMVKLSTRRGKQFNSIVFRAKDPQMGDAKRDIVFLSEAEALAHGIATGDRIALTNDLGRYEGTARIANLPPRHAVMYWPEANVLIARHYDPEAGVPDYNALVRVEKVE